MMLRPRLELPANELKHLILPDELMKLQNIKNFWLADAVSRGFFEPGASIDSIEPFKLDFVDRTSQCEGHQHLGLQNTTDLTNEQITQQVMFLLGIDKATALNVMHAYTQAAAGMIKNILSCAILQTTDPNSLRQISVTRDLHTDLTQNIFKSASGEICLQYDEAEYFILDSAHDDRLPSLPGPIKALFKLTSEMDDENNIIWGFKLQYIRTDNPFIVAAFNDHQFNEQNILKLSSSKDNLHLKLQVLKRSQCALVDVNPFVEQINLIVNSILTSGITIEMLDHEVDCIKAACLFPSANTLSALYQCILSHEIACGTWLKGSLSGIIFGAAGMVGGIFLASITLGFGAALGAIGLTFFSSGATVAKSTDKRNVLADIEQTILKLLVTKLFTNGNYTQYALASVKMIQAAASERRKNEVRDKALTECIEHITQHYIHNDPYKKNVPLHDLRITCHLYQAYDKLRTDSANSYSAKQVMGLIIILEQLYIQQPKSAMALEITEYHRYLQLKFSYMKNDADRDSKPNKDRNEVYDLLSKISIENFDWMRPMLYQYADDLRNGSDKNHNEMAANALINARENIVKFEQSIQAKKLIQGFES